MYLNYLRSSDPLFKPLNFTNGINLIRANQDKKSTDKQSSNGLGKSLSIECIDFCLGRTRLQRLAHPSLVDTELRLGLVVAGRCLEVSRLVGGKMVRITGDVDKLLFGKWKQQGIEATPTEWAEWLGQECFALGSEHREASITFRNLISHFVRAGSESFHDAFSPFEKEDAVIRQVRNAFLLGLNWQDGNTFKTLRAKETEVKAIKKSVSTGAFKELGGDAAKLQAEAKNLSKEIQEIRERLAKFVIHEDYSQIQRDCDLITLQMRDLQNDQHSNSQLLDSYRKSISEDVAAPAALDVERFFTELGVHLASNLVHSLSDVEQFHIHLLENRKQFLSTEIQRLENVNASHSSLVSELDQKRSKLLQILGTTGALEEYSAIQAHLTSKEAHLEMLKLKVSNLQMFEKGNRDLKVKLSILANTAQARLETEFSDAHTQATNYFYEYSHSLYDTPGTLEIAYREGSGFHFHAEIPRANSDGYEHMAVFCYDLSVSKLWSLKRNHPGILIHDGALFDPVDSRQVRSALTLMKRECVEQNIQYICPISSYVLQDWTDFEENIRLELEDAEDGSGALFGRWLE